MALSDGKQFAMAAIGIGLFAFLAIFLFSSAFGMVYDADTSTLTQDEGVSYEVTDPLYSNATTINDVGGNVTVNLTDQKTGDNTSATIDENSNQTLSINGEDINVTVDNISGSTTAQLSYSYPNDYGWSDGSKSLFGILPLMMLVVLLAGLGALAFRFM